MSAMRPVAFLTLLYLAAAAVDAAPVPGTALLLPLTGAAATAGEQAAREFGAGLCSAPSATCEPAKTLTVPAGVRALWWHCEQAPLPPVMLRSEVKRALLAWLGEGHGLFLSGTALSYLTVLGLEPASPRLSGSGGSDRFTAGINPGAFADHPIYSGFARAAPVLLTEGGYPPFADFYGSGGPLSGSVIGAAYPDAGENPLVEHGYGGGRVIAMSWRLPHYALNPNAQRANLEHLTRNILAYLAAGSWHGSLRDGRYRVLSQALDRVNPQAFERGVRDLSATYPERYTRGPQYLALLARLPAVKEAVRREEEGALTEGSALLAQLDEALLSNPLLDFRRLLLVKRGEGNLGLPYNWQSNSSLPREGFDNELAVLSPVRPGGELRTLYRPAREVFVGDVDLDFDARRLLFSMPAFEGNGCWQVFELNADGSGLRQVRTIEEPEVDNYDACYLPDGNLLFTSTASFTGVPCVTGYDHVSNLYRLDRASGRIRQLGFEQDHDWCPTVLPNGRILYLRWEYSDLPHFVSRILFTMNPDGTGQGEFYGSNSYWPNALFYARPVPGEPTKFAAVVGGHHDHPRMGELTLFDAARGKHEADGAVQRIPGFGKPVTPTLLDGLTAGSWPKYLHPYPLSEKYFLTACKPSPASRWGIYLADVFDNLTLIKELDGYALLEPVPLRATSRPPVIPPQVDESRRDALVSIEDIYRGSGLRGIPRGTIKQLRLFSYHFCYRGMGGQVNRVGLDGPWDVKRIVGTVPVESDGSAYFRVPANTPLSLQPLDEQGQALQLMRSWMTAMPGEVVSCVGCHEARASSVATVRTAALKRPPSAIAPWYGPTRGFSFVREVQPVLDAHCLRCHDGGERSPAPDLRNRPAVHPPGPDNGYQQGSVFTPSYLALKAYVRNATIESDMHVLMPGEFAADTTRLMQLLRRGHHRVQLDHEAWDRLTTWIDLNAPAHGTWHEIVGTEAVDRYRERRREMQRRYAGADEDPEAILPVSYRPSAAAPGGAPPGVEGAESAPSEAPTAAFPFDAAEAQRRQAALGPGERSLDLGAGVTLKLVRIPAGEFTMGDRHGATDERPTRAVQVPRPFWLGKLEITNEQYARFDPVHDSRHEEGDYLQFSVEERGYPVSAPRQPVCRVSWQQARVFCDWLSRQTGVRASLPTEAQWEWACRAGSPTPLWWGETGVDFAQHANLADASLRRVDNFAPWGLPFGAIYPWRPALAEVDDGHRVSAPVGSYRPNAWGLHDMHGNVAEWTSDTYHDYPYRGDTAGAGRKVVRGGSWYDRPERARSAARAAYPPYRGVYDVGFRVAVE